ncbi:site-specific integrase [Parapedobacter tibetensis]|uniref:site-specific integrase n=1 Tax=Parapedobacter tibetensis TaxID=2972951 RepID=UPI00214DDB66|nr:site-specific integrase [Parapedobacter tibetensis]
MENLKGVDFAPGTVKRYETSLSHTRQFIKWKYGLDDIELKKLDYEFISEYEYWLKTVRKCNHNTTMKYLANFKKIVLHCVNLGRLPKDPFFGFKLVKKEVIRPYLTSEELDTIQKKDFKVERLNLIRDIFVFSCFTGLAYIDVYNLHQTQIAKGMDGEFWIALNRQKTQTPTRVPLLPQAIAIIEKYREHPRCKDSAQILPILTNQKTNAYLKEIATLCGISKELTFHIARHTFATTITLSNGVPLETVSKMLGHKSLKQTQHYAKIIDIKISQDMKTLKEKLNSKAVGIYPS